MPADALTVLELTEAVRAVLDEAFAGELWVEGEISSLKRSPAPSAPGRSGGGHVYFDLVERGAPGQPPLAAIPVSLFASARQHVNRVLRRAGGVRMADGMRVRIRGKVELHAARGRITLRMSGIDPTYTLGLLVTERDRLARQLEAEGLLRRNAAMPLPAMPERLGLVTSDGSAAMADFLHELEASGLGWRVVFADARVQGTDADRHLVAAVAAVVGRGVGAVALVRGGGARTDLATFDSEVLARAIAACPVPVLTGVGHEVDVSVADLVAHTAAKTPTACAAGLVERARGLVRRGDDAWAGVAGRATRHLDRADERLVRAAGRARGAARHHLRTHEGSLDQRAGQVASRASWALRGAEAHLATATTRVGALDPARALARGWSITRTADGRVVRHAAAVVPGDALVTQVADGELASVVTSLGEPGAAPERRGAAPERRGAGGDRG